MEKPFLPSLLFLVMILAKLKVNLIFYHFIQVILVSSLIEAMLTFLCSIQSSILKNCALFFPLHRIRVKYLNQLGKPQFLPVLEI